MMYDGMDTGILRNLRDAARKDVTRAQADVQRLSKAIARRRRGHPDDTMPASSYRPGKPAYRLYRRSIANPPRQRP